MKMKLTEEGFKALHEILTSQLNQFDPFGKDADQSDVMFAVRDMAQRPRTDLNKRFLPRAKSTRA